MLVFITNYGTSDEFYDACGADILVTYMPKNSLETILKIEPLVTELNDYITQCNVPCVSLSHVVLSGPAMELGYRSKMMDFLKVNNIKTHSIETSFSYEDENFVFEINDECLINSNTAIAPLNFEIGNVHVHSKYIAFSALTDYDDVEIYAEVSSIDILRKVLKELS